MRFTNAQIGVSNDDDLIALAANDLTVNGAATVTSTMDVTSDFAVNTNKFKVTGTNGNTEIFGAVSLTGDSATITHSGSTGLTISSAAGQYVDVELVRITDNQIGVSGKADLLTLTTGGAAVDGTLDASGNFRVATSKFTVDASNGNTVVDGTLGVNGAATFEGQVTVKGFFQALGDYRIGDSTSADTLTVAAVSNYTGDTTMMEKLDVYGTTTLHDAPTATSASLSSTLSVSGTSTLAAATLSSTLGVTGHTTATSATLSGALTVNAASTLNGAATVTGAVSLSATAATITHTGTGGATNGLAITSTQGYVDVESVRRSPPTRSAHHGRGSRQAGVELGDGQGFDHGGYHAFIHGRLCGQHRQVQGDCLPPELCRCCGADNHPQRYNEPDDIELSGSGVREDRGRVVGVRGRGGRADHRH